MIPGANSVVDILQGISQRVENVPNEGLGDRCWRTASGWRVCSVVIYVFVKKILKTSTIAEFHIESQLLGYLLRDKSINVVHDIRMFQNLEKQNLSLQGFVCLDFFIDAAYP